MPSPSKSGQHHECFLRDEGRVPTEVCIQLSSSPHNNKICVKMECASPWRRCSSCAEHKTIEGDSKVVDRDSGLCLFHVDHGIDYKKPVNGEKALTPIIHTPSHAPRRSGGVMPVVPAKKGAGVVHGKVEVKHQGPKSLAAILQEVMKTASEPTDVMISAIQRFEEQPREMFNEKELQELGESLQIVQIVPVFLRKLTPEEVKRNPGVLYELVDGERRWRACNKVGKKTIRAIFLEVADKNVQFAISAIANFGRKEHTPREEALALQFMRMELRMSVVDAAKAFSRSDAWAHQRLALLDLHDEVQKMLDSNLPKGKRIASSLASFLAGYKNKEFQLECVREILDKGLSHGSAITFIRRRAAEKNIVTARKRTENTPKYLLKKASSFVSSAAARCDSLITLPRDQLIKMFPDRVSQKVIHAKLLELGKRINQLATLIEA